MVFCGNTRVRAQQGVNISGLVAETGQQEHIEVTGQAGLAPMLNGKSANEAEASATGFKKRLQPHRFGNQVNRGAAWNSSGPAT